MSYADATERSQASQDEALETIRAGKKPSDKQRTILIAHGLYYLDSGGKFKPTPRGRERLKEGSLF